MRRSTSLVGLMAIGAAATGWVAISNAGEIAAAMASIMAEDPISGEWSGTVSGDAFPEDLNLAVTFTMDVANEVTGIFVVEGEEAPFEGEFDPETNTLTGDVSAEGAIWSLTLTLDGDTLEGEASEAFSGQEADVILVRAED